MKPQSVSLVVWVLIMVTWSRVSVAVYVGYAQGVKYDRRKDSREN